MSKSPDNIDTARERGGYLTSLALLTITVWSAGYARTALSPLQEHMRSALQLSDNDIGMLQGLALGVPLAIAAIPLGFLTDRTSRVRLLTVLAIVYTAANAMTALAQGFWTLLAARGLIGLTTFAVTPVALSLIADYFPPNQRGRAHTAVAIGQFVGISSAFALGGVLLQHQGGVDGWRSALLWMNAPLLLVILLSVLLLEPPRAGRMIASPSPRQALRELRRFRRVVTPLFLGVVFLEISIDGALIWAAPMLQRAHALGPATAGSIVASALLAGGIIGSIVGGFAADFAQCRGGPQRTMAVLASVALLTVPTALFPLAPSASASGVGFTLFVALVMASVVMATTLFTLVIPNEIRGLCMAMLAAASVLIGNGLGPMLISLTTGLGAWLAPVDHALALVAVLGCVGGAISFAFGIRRFPRAEISEAAAANAPARMPDA